ncbi:hypothetical protein [Clostridium aminobutyricum]|uniref:Uncharacterized protein n=1 Tax=Clostridium aminobutyricum TaxID=33953 RepID=A0A939DBP3_CLOAM|nr:hypothetical protein [Clostridium aminobutyricum]MBN7774338.1 hypothetical protein [Clostridium aminobutyricum]
MDHFKKKFTGRKAAAFVLLVYGGFFIFSFGMANSFDSATSDGTKLVCSIFTILGIVMVFIGNRKRRLHKKYSSYATIISLDQTGSIRRYAASMGVSQEVVKKDLQRLIAKKYFNDAYMDEQANRIVFPWNSDDNETYEENDEEDVEDYSEEEAEEDMEDYSEEDTEKNTENKYTTVSCKNCGGINNVIVGKVHECEYCGSPISQ